MAAVLTFLLKVFLPCQFLLLRFLGHGPVHTAFLWGGLLLLEHRALQSLLIVFAS